MLQPTQLKYKCIRFLGHTGPTLYYRFTKERIFANFIKWSNNLQHNLYVSFHKEQNFIGLKRKWYFFEKTNMYLPKKLVLKGRVHIFFIRELDVPPLGESNLMGPKKSVEVKFFTRALFGQNLKLLSIFLSYHFSWFFQSFVKYFFLSHKKQF